MLPGHPPSIIDGQEVYDRYPENDRTFYGNAVNVGPFELCYCLPGNDGSGCLQRQRLVSLYGMEMCRVTA